MLVVRYLLTIMFTQNQEKAPLEIITSDFCTPTLSLILLILYIILILKLL